MGEQKLGRYTSKLILEPMPGRQQMKTVEDFGFQDADGTHWPVPPGTSVDGTSIPKAVWSLLGRPWEGKYREASVLHDYHCTARSADWQTVHRMFYRAMLVSGVSERRAKLVYAGVLYRRSALGKHCAAQPACRSEPNSSRRYIVRPLP